MVRYTKAGLIGLLAGSICAAVFLVYDLRIERIVEFVPGERNAFVDPLYPPGRWQRPTSAGQRLVAEPGYTDILIPKGYRTIEVSGTLENPGEIPISVGFRSPQGMLLTPSDDPSHFTFQVAVMKVTVVKQRATFIVSAPKLREEQAVPPTLQSLHVRYLDPVWAEGSWWQRLRSMLKVLV